MYYMKKESKNWETLGALTTFFFVSKEPYMINFFAKLCTSQIEATLWAPVTKQKQMCFIQLTFSVYIHQN